MSISRVEVKLLKYLEKMPLEMTKCLPHDSISFTFWT